MSLLPKPPHELASPKSPTTRATVRKKRVSIPDPRASTHYLYDGTFSRWNQAVGIPTDLHFLGQAQAIEGVVWVAGRHPELRPLVAARLAYAIGAGSPDDGRTTWLAVAALRTDDPAVLDAVRQAMARGAVDTGVTGKDIDDRGDPADWFLTREPVYDTAEAYFAALRRHAGTADRPSIPMDSAAQKRVAHRRSTRKAHAQGPAQGPQAVQGEAQMIGIAGLVAAPGRAHESRNRGAALNRRHPANLLFARDFSSQREHEASPRPDLKIHRLRLGFRQMCVKWGVIGVNRDL